MAAVLVTTLGFNAAMAQERTLRASIDEQTKIDRSAARSQPPGLRDPESH